MLSRILQSNPRGCLVGCEDTVLAQAASRQNLVLEQSSMTLALRAARLAAAIYGKASARSYF